MTSCVDMTTQTLHIFLFKSVLLSLENSKIKKFFFSVLELSLFIDFIFELLIYVLYCICKM